MRRALGLAVALAVIAPPARAAPGCEVVVVPLGAGTTVHGLGRTFLRAGSDSAWTRGGPLERGRDYRLDPLRGELRMLVPVPGDTVWIRVCGLVAPPPLEVQHHAWRAPGAAPRDSAAVRAAPVARPATARDLGQAPAGASLQVSGNKTVAIEFGSSQDAFLRQSLDLSMSGALAPGVHLTGVLSDRNTPLTAAGATQDLQSLDRLLIELDAPQGSAALGDVALGLDRGEFARLERRVQGVRGEWRAGPMAVSGAAANAQGEYFRMQFYGVEGRQGPYLLTDRNGVTGIAVVAGSEVVTVDGTRLARGESADYAIDYERGRVTFTNRRPITATTRITVEYQFTVNRYRRNLAVAGGRWERGGSHLFTQALLESDDRGRPLDQILTPADREALTLAGDSVSLAAGPGVTPGVGDYDTVRVTPSTAIFAWAGPDSGAFAVRFVRVGPGRGDYAESTLVAGRTAYRWVGLNAGAFRVGRALPLPESHQLVALGGGTKLGVVALEAEGAVSRRDLNSFSALDDDDNTGGALRGRATLTGRLPGRLGTGQLELRAREVGERFAPFGRLDRPFAEEEWGLAFTGDLERSRRLELSGSLEPAGLGTLRGSAGRLSAPGGVSSVRRGLEWSREGMLATRARWDRADSEEPGRAFAEGGRERWSGEARLATRWLEPALRVEADERLTPADTGRAGERWRDLGAELASPRALPWRAVVGYSVRRDGRLHAAAWNETQEVRAWRGALETPAGGRLGATVSWQRRERRGLADPLRAVSDLASLRLRAEDAPRGLAGSLGLEVTSEGENRRLRQLVFVGPGQGGYDASGNFIGTGDYDLVLTVSPEIERLARAATSARLEWRFGAGDAWRGSRAGFDFESDARRRGALRAHDPLPAPDAVLGDPAFARASVLQRFETELAPGSRVATVRMRLERRVTADRGFENFASTLDDRLATARWRARPSGALSAEVEARLRRQSAGQQLAGAVPFARTLESHAGTALVAWSPGARLRVSGAAELSWSRPEGADAFTRTLRVGPDVSIGLGQRGRIETTFRRAFRSGPPAVALLPSAESAEAPEWETTGRVDYRLHATTTVGLSVTARERPDRDALVNGRAEVRAFF